MSLIFEQIKKYFSEHVVSERNNLQTNLFLLYVSGEKASKDELALLALLLREPLDTPEIKNKLSLHIEPGRKIDDDLRHLLVALGVRDSLDKSLSPDACKSVITQFVDNSLDKQIFALTETLKKFIDISFNGYSAKFLPSNLIKSIDYKNNASLRSAVAKLAYYQRQKGASSEKLTEQQFAYGLLKLYESMLLKESDSELYSDTPGIKDKAQKFMMNPEVQYQLPLSELGLKFTEVIAHIEMLVSRKERLQKEDPIKRLKEKLKEAEEWLKEQPKTLKNGWVFNGDLSKLQKCIKSCYAGGVFEQRELAHLDNPAKLQENLNKLDEAFSQAKLISSTQTQKTTDFLRNAVAQVKACVDGIIDIACGDIIHHHSIGIGYTATDLLPTLYAGLTKLPCVSYQIRGKNNKPQHSKFPTYFADTPPWQVDLFFDESNVQASPLNSSELKRLKKNLDEINKVTESLKRVANDKQQEDSNSIKALFASVKIEYEEPDDTKLEALKDFIVTVYHEKIAPHYLASSAEHFGLNYRGNDDSQKKSQKRIANRKFGSGVTYHGKTHPGFRCNAFLDSVRRHFYELSFSLYSTRVKIVKNQDEFINLMLYRIRSLPRKKDEESRIKIELLAKKLNTLRKSSTKNYDTVFKIGVGYRRTFYTYYLEKMNTEFPTVTFEKLTAFTQTLDKFSRDYSSGMEEVFSVEIAAFRALVDDAKAVLDKGKNSKKEKHLGACLRNCFKGGTLEGELDLNNTVLNKESRASLNLSRALKAVKAEQAATERARLVTAVKKHREFNKLVRKNQILQTTNFNSNLVLLTEHEKILSRCDVTLKTTNFLDTVVNADDLSGVKKLLLTLEEPRVELVQSTRENLKKTLDLFLEVFFINDSSIAASEDSCKLSSQAQRVIDASYGDKLSRMFEKLKHSAGSDLLSFDQSGMNGLITMLEGALRLYVISFLKSLPDTSLLNDAYNDVSTHLGDCQNELNLILGSSPAFSILNKIASIHASTRDGLGLALVAKSDTRTLLDTVLEEHPKLYKAVRLIQANPSSISIPSHREYSTDLGCVERTYEKVKYFFKFPGALEFTPVQGSLVLNKEKLEKSSFTTDSAKHHLQQYKAAVARLFVLARKVEANVLNARRVELTSLLKAIKSYHPDLTESQTEISTVINNFTVGEFNLESDLNEEAIDPNKLDDSQYDIHISALKKMYNELKAVEGKKRANELLDKHANEKNQAGKIYKLAAERNKFLEKFKALNLPLTTKFLAYLGKLSVASSIVTKGSLGSYRFNPNLLDAAVHEFEDTLFDQFESDLLNEALGLIRLICNDSSDLFASGEKQQLVDLKNVIEAQLSDASNNAISVCSELMRFKNKLTKIAKSRKITDYYAGDDKVVLAELRKIDVASKSSLASKNWLVLYAHMGNVKSQMRAFLGESRPEQTSNSLVERRMSIPDHAEIIPGEVSAITGTSGEQQQTIDSQVEPENDEVTLLKDEEVTVLEDNGVESADVIPDETNVIPGSIGDPAATVASNPEADSIAGSTDSGRDSAVSGDASSSLTGSRDESGYAPTEDDLQGFNASGLSAAPPEEMTKPAVAPRHSLLRRIFGQPSSLNDRSGADTRPELDTASKSSAQTLQEGLADNSGEPSKKPLDDVQDPAPLVKKPKPEIKLFPNSLFDSESEGDSEDENDLLSDQTVTPRVNDTDSSIPPAKTISSKDEVAPGSNKDTDNSRKTPVRSRIRKLEAKKPAIPASKVEAPTTRKKPNTRVSKRARAMASLPALPKDDGPAPLGAREALSEAANEIKEYHKRLVKHLKSLADKASTHHRYNGYNDQINLIHNYCVDSRKLNNVYRKTQNVSEGINGAAAYRDAESQLRNYNNQVDLLLKSIITQLDSFDQDFNETVRNQKGIRGFIKRVSNRLGRFACWIRNCFSAEPAHRTHDQFVAELRNQYLPEDIFDIETANVERSVNHNEITFTVKAKDIAPVSTRTQQPWIKHKSEADPATNLFGVFNSNTDLVELPGSKSVKSDPIAEIEQAPPSSFSVNASP